jgi:NADPH:quinone reductase-like Zn-dependent oxidoreductase
MKAVVCTGYGPPEVLHLEQVAKPTPGDNEVLIRVVATTVHAGDVRIRAFDVPRGQRLMAHLVLGIRRPKHPILGMELAGIVEAVGRDVTLFGEGDEVLAFTGWGFGAYAQYTCLPEKPRKSAEKEGMIVGKPTTMTFEEAAAGLSTGGITALRLLTKADVRSGQEVLIYGASGSVGTYAVQLAKYLGTTVTGVCSTGNLEMVRSLGADRVIDYTQHDFTAGPERYDVIVDAVGKVDRARAKGRLTSTGVLLNVVKDSGAPGGVRREDLVFLTGLVERGQIRAVIDRRYPLEQIVEAHLYVGLGHKRGHVVITVADPPGDPANEVDPTPSA